MCVGVGGCPEGQSRFLKYVNTGGRNTTGRGRGRLQIGAVNNLEGTEGEGGEGGARGGRGSPRPRVREEGGVDKVGSTAAVVAGRTHGTGRTSERYKGGGRLVAGGHVF